MQLFITPYASQWDVITITDERVVHQLKNVLRSKPWDLFNIQNIVGNEAIRISCKITALDKISVTAVAYYQEAFTFIDNDTYLLVALPNKIEKMEMIVQKCTEMWLQHLIFFPSQYSQVRDLSENKIERLRKIALEAVEQSYWLCLPEIVFAKDALHYLQQWNIYMLHQEWENIKNISLHNEKWKKYFFVWPEWWRSPEEERTFSSYNASKISLWKNILRTETAAILTAWEAIK